MNSITSFNEIYCFYHTCLYIQSVKLSDDVEKTPAPESYSAKHLQFIIEN